VRALASVLFYLMSEDPGTEAGWQINGEKAMLTPWHGTLIQREEKFYMLDQVYSQHLPPHWSHVRYVPSTCLPIGHTFYMLD
jgi:hypothetical protein